MNQNNKIQTHEKNIQILHSKTTPKAKECACLAINKEESDKLYGGL